MIHSVLSPLTWYQAIYDPNLPLLLLQLAAAAVAMSSSSSSSSDSDDAGSTVPNTLRVATASAAPVVVHGINI